MNGSDGTGGNGDGTLTDTLFGWWRRRYRNGETTARKALAEMIDERQTTDVAIGEDQRTLLGNVLDLRDRAVADVMVPSADIIAIDIEAPLTEVVETMTTHGHSRLPVYRGVLDDAAGMVHIKDVLGWRGGGDGQFSLAGVVRKVLFVAPSMRVLELLLEMRVSRCHMALVVDEFGGVDGLVTIEDLVEEIVGEIEDEHDYASGPEMTHLADGAIETPARTAIETLEAEFGRFATDDERDDIDTLGGLVFQLAGRVPIRGELVRHPSGLEFEVVDADPRSIKYLRIRKPSAPAPGQDE